MLNRRTTSKESAEVSEGSPCELPCEIAGIVYKTLYDMNVEDARMLGLSGPRGWPNYRGSGLTDRIIQPGELAFFDIYNVSYSGYRSCYYRTFCVGRRPTAKQKDWYKQCYDWLYAALGEVKPGATTAAAGSGSRRPAGIRAPRSRTRSGPWWVPTTG